MTTEVVFRRGDIVRHSPAFMARFTKQHGNGPGHPHYERIAQSKGLVMGRYEGGDYHVIWDYEEDLPREALREQPPTDGSDMVLDAVRH
jgi:hypothetical protein